MIPQIRIEDLKVFECSALLGSLSAAARQLEISPAVASAAVQRLEQQLQVRLFVRSTRALRLTLEGEQFLGYSRESLRHLTEGYQQLHGNTQDNISTLQLTAPSDLGRNILLNWLNQFQNEHPKLNIRLILSDQLADLFRQPIDIAIRYGYPEDSSLIAIPLTLDNRRVLCAAPDYLREYGTPQQLEDLQNHQCLLFMRDGQAHDQWPFLIGNEKRIVKVTGNRVCNDADIVKRWAIDGYGLAYKSWIDVADEIKSGKLITLFDHYVGESLPLYLLCPHRSQLSTTVRQLSVFLQQQCKERMAELERVNYCK